MKLRGIHFSSVFNASGARNFDGSGWWYHKLIPGLEGAFRHGTTFVAKTTTMHPRAGNMPLETPMKPKNRFPDCIVVDLRKGHALNAVGLSGPGAKWLLENRVWADREHPFFVSFMSVEASREARLMELFEFVGLLQQYLPFRAPVGLQINFSCPNVGLDPKALVGEMTDALDVASVLGVPLVPKINATFPIETVLPLKNHPACDAISVSNTIPWGKLPERIDWKALFDTDVSPLAKYGGGGLSGAPLLPIVRDYIRDLRRAGFDQPIIGGGGILSADDAQSVLEAGASAIELGSIAMLRPWRVRSTILRVHDLAHVLPWARP